MTTQEAIKCLRDISDGMPFDKCLDWIEACDMAIRSLKAWDEVIHEFAEAVPWCIDTNEDIAYADGLCTGYGIVQRCLEEVEDERK